MRTWMLTATAALCSMLGLAGAAGASGRTPTLLATAPGGANSFLVRPAFMSFDNSLDGRTPDYLLGPGLTQQGFEHDRYTPITWSTWGTRAAGRATYWLGYSDACGDCRNIRYEVRLVAWRVRQGHYTRFGVTVPRGTVVYALDRIRIRANGVPGGLSAYAWCWAKQPRPCTPP